MAGFLKEFREFAVKGNVVDMAVGIIIGAAFGKIVTSLVADVITPPLGYVIGGVDFTQMSFEFPAFVEGKTVVLAYGKFLQAVFDFSIVALAIFLLVKGINTLKRNQAAAPVIPPPPSRQEVLLEQIRDLLSKRS